MSVGPKFFKNDPLGISEWDTEGDKQQALGILLATADMAREVRPPAGTTARRALLVFSEVTEKLAVSAFGQAAVDELRREIDKALSAKGEVH